MNTQRHIVSDLDCLIIAKGCRSRQSGRVMMFSRHATIKHEHGLSYRVNRGDKSG
jgi:hypothetical protein